MRRRCCEGSVQICTFDAPATCIQPSGRPASERWWSRIAWPSGGCALLLTGWWVRVGGRGGLRGSRFGSGGCRGGHRRRGIHGRSFSTEEMGHGQGDRRRRLPRRGLPTYDQADPTLYVRDDIAVGPGRLPEVAAERRGGCPGEGAPPVGPTYALLASAALRREMMTQMRGP